MGNTCIYLEYSSVFFLNFHAFHGDVDCIIRRKGGRIKNTIHTRCLADEIPARIQLVLVTCDSVGFDNFVKLLYKLAARLESTRLAREVNFQSILTGTGAIPGLLSFLSDTKPGSLVSFPDMVR